MENNSSLPNKKSKMRISSNKDPRRPKKKNTQTSTLKNSKKIVQIEDKDAVYWQEKALRYNENQMASQPLKLSPDVVIFYNIAPDSYFEKKLVLKNVTNVKRKLIIKKPSSDNFKLEFSNQGFLAPGISLVLNVRFIFRSSKKSDSGEKIMNGGDMNSKSTKLELSEFNKDKDMIMEVIFIF